MKTMKKLLSLLLVATTILSFGACKKEKSSVGENAGATVIFRDFENWGPDFQTTQLMLNFGKVSRNEELEFVRSGAYSCKIQPLGTRETNTKPMLYWPTISTTFDYDVSDFKNLDYISFWMYNASEETEKVTVGMVTGIETVDKISTLSGDTFSLPSKQWTQVRYYIDFNAAAIASKVTPEMISNVQGIYLQFENTQSSYVKDAPVLYLDDMKLCYKTKDAEIKDAFVLEPNEICDFERVYQWYTFKPNIAYNGSELCIPEVKVVKASEHDIATTSGQYAMQLTVKSGTDTTSTKQPRVSFIKELLQRSDFTKIDPKDYDNTYFSFDVYNVQEEQFRFNVWFHADVTATDENGQPINPYVFRTEFDFYAQPKTWTTFKIPFSKINSASYIKDQKHRSVYDESAYAKIKTPGEFNLCWLEKDTVGGDKVFYVDNIRITQG